MPNSFSYAVLRIVPRVEREEFINVGVVLFCPERQFLDAKVRLNPARLATLAPHIDLDLVQSRLQGWLAVCHGTPEAGALASLSVSARFHWLVNPRSTLLQISPVHSGLCDDPPKTLDRLFQNLCL